MEIDKRLQILKDYLDKSFISAILCQYHYEFYNKINYIAMFPLVIGSSILTVLNSSTIEESIMKYINISVNGLNTLVIALTTNYKLNDRLTTYKTLYSKYQKLSHKIEASINNSSEITDRILDDIITEFDNITNDNEYGYLKSYKNKIIKKYASTHKLPNSLQLDGDLVMINPV
jgi:23S rRNA U2552 (ribose-2'-O)-methylase RlmE/FtsJ